MKNISKLKLYLASHFSSKLKCMIAMYHKIIKNVHSFEAKNTFVILNYCLRRRYIPKFQFYKLHYIISIKNLPCGWMEVLRNKGLEPSRSGNLQGSSLLGPESFHCHLYYCQNSSLQFVMLCSIS